MAYQKVGIGSSANDGTGDTLRVGADKINENFEDLWGKINGVANSAVNDGTALTSDTVVLRTATQTLTNKTLTTPIISVISNSGNLTLPSGSPDTLVGRATTDTLTNKTLTAPTISGVVSGTTTSQTITTLTTGGITGSGGALEITAENYIVEFRGDGTTNGVVGQIQLNCSYNTHGQKIKAQPHSASVTNEMLLPAGGNSTLVSEIATQTLTNKTLTSPDINTPDIDGGAIDGAVIGGNTPAAITGTAISGTSVTVTGTNGAVTLPTLTTTERNALSAANGMLVYNSTTTKIEAYANGAWVALH